MQCVVDSAGVLVVSTIEPCPGWMVVTPAEAQAMVGQITTESLATIGVTAESLSLSFGFGFGWVVALVGTAWAVRLAVKVIGKL